MPTLGNSPPVGFFSTPDLTKTGGKCADSPPRCILVPYSKAKDLCGKTRKGTKKTGHHLVADRCLRSSPVVLIEDFGEYSHGTAPTMCVAGASWHMGTHKKLHDSFDVTEAKTVLSQSKSNTSGGVKQQGTWTYAEAKEAAIESAKPCKRKCIEAQLDKYYEDHCGLKSDSKLRCTIERKAIKDRAEKPLSVRKKAIKKKGGL